MSHLKNTSSEGLGPATASRSLSQLGSGSVPPGGPTGSALRKLSNTDYDYDWAGTTTVRGINKVVYIAVRTDGLAGSGTPEDPFDGSTAAKLKAIIDAASTYTQLNLGAGTFFSNGGTDIVLKAGQILKGAGIGITTIKAANTGSTTFSIVDATEGADLITVEGMTLDCDWQNQFVSNTKSGGVTLRGDHCIIRGVHLKNFGGDFLNGEEAFPLLIKKSAVEVDNGLIEDCIVTDPVLGGSNTSYYGTCLAISGSGVIQRNYVNATGMFGANVSRTGIQRPILIQNNHFHYCERGVYGDSGDNIRAIVRGNLFEGNRRNMFIDPIPGTHSIEWCLIEGNVFLARTSGDMSNAGSNLRISGDTADPDSGGTILIRGNYFGVDDFSTSPSQSGVWVGAARSVICENNLVSPLVDWSNCGIHDTVSVSSERGNTFEDGTWCSNFVADNAYKAVVPDCGNAAMNGVNLKRGLALQKEPGGSPRAADNLFVLEIEAGDFNLESVTTIYDYVSINGAGIHATRIRCSSDTALRYNGARNLVNLCDLTLCGDGNAAFDPGATDNNSGGVFLNVHFTAINGGTLFANVAYGFGTDLIGCTSDIPIANSSADNRFRAKAFNCRFPKGFFAKVQGGVIEDTTIGENGLALSGLSSIEAGSIFRNSTIVGTGQPVCTGSVTFERCTFEITPNSATHAITLAAGCKVRGCTIVAKSPATNSVDSVASASLSISGSILSLGIGTNITNLVSPAYNVDDPNV